MSHNAFRLILSLIGGALCLQSLDVAAQERPAPRAGEPYPAPALQQVDAGHVRAMLLLNRLRHASRYAEQAHESARRALLAPSGAADASSPQAGAIAGRVSGLTDAAWDGVYVLAWQADSTGTNYGSGYAKPAADGTYRIENLDAGSYYVMASAQGFLPLFYDNAGTLEEATVVRVGEETVDGIDFEMEAIRPGTGSISGRVLAEAGLGPIAGADLYAFDPNQPDRYGHAVSGQDGTYEIPALHAGSYVVQVFARGYLAEFFEEAASFEEAAPVQVDESGVRAGIDFTLATGGTISGTVYDGNGAPVAGASITAMSALAVDSTGVGADGQVWAGWNGGWAVSDENGVYRIEGLHAGEYLALAQTWTQWSYVAQWYNGATVADEATPIAVAEGAETPGIDFDLPTASFSGAIAGKITDERGDPLSDAFVTAETNVDGGTPGQSDQHVRAYALTDRTGAYVIEALPAGAYRVSAAAQIGWEYVQRWYPDGAVPQEAEPVVVGDGERREGIDLALPSGVGLGRLSGLVRDGEGHPLAGAHVDATASFESPQQDDGSVGPIFSAYGVSDSSGAYEIRSLPAGSYVVHAAYWDGDQFGQAWYDGVVHPDQATPVALAEDEDRRAIDFQLEIRPMYGTVEGLVTTESGLPIQRAYVELSSVGRHNQFGAPIWYASTHAVTDEKGRFIIEQVAEGSYLMAVYGRAGFEYYDDAASVADATPLRVIGGNVYTLDVSLSKRDDGDGVIAGSVTSEEYAEAWTASGPTTPSTGTGAMEIAVVHAQPLTSEGQPSDADPGYATVTAPDGSYRLTGLATGDYLVYAFAPTHAGEYYDDAYSPQEADIVQVDGIRPTEDVDFRLWPVYYFAREADGGLSGVTVHGLVTDATGAAVEGATVHVLDEGERPVASARSGADGSFEISGLMPGNYRVHAGKIGYIGRYNGGTTDFVEAQPIPMTGGRIEVNLVVTTGTGTGTEQEASLPHTIELLGNYPNPFNPETSILFRLAEAAPVRLVVYDVLGHEVAVLLDGQATAGLHTVRWDGRSSLGVPAGSGPYFYRLESSVGARSGAMILVR